MLDRDHAGCAPKGRFFQSTPPGLFGNVKFRRGFAWLRCFARLPLSACIRRCGLRIARDHSGSPPSSFVVSLFPSPVHAARNGNSRTVPGSRTRRCLNAVGQQAVSLVTLYAETRAEGRPPSAHARTYRTVSPLPGVHLGGVPQTGHGKP